MRFEHIWALFRTFKIDNAERKIVQHRAVPLGGGGSIPGQVQNAERWIAALESKAGVLLTHISMMIAVTGLMLAISSESLWYEVVLALELAAYLLLALLCIRCQNHYGTNEFSKVVNKGPNPKDGAPHHVYQNAVFGELFFREWLFPKIQWALYLLTLMLILTVFYGLLADEFGLFQE